MNRTTSLLIIALVSMAIAPCDAREKVEPVRGLHSYTPRVHALINATVVASPGNVTANATVVLRDGLIEAVGRDVTVPPDARTWDLTGKTIYAGFIDAFSHFGMPEGLKPFKRRESDGNGPAAKRQSSPQQPGAASWNPLVTPEREAADHFEAGEKDAAKLSDLGFATVATFPGRGIFRGRGALISLNGKSINEAALKLSTVQHIAFEQSSTPRREVKGDGPPYPTSLMGSIALVRQTLYDAAWQRRVEQAYRENPSRMQKPAENAALLACKPLLENGQLVIVQAWDELDYQRIDRLASEFDIAYAILGNGYEYRRAKILKELGATLILPLAFPPTPHVERPDASLDVSLEQLQHWNLAPSNPAFLAEEDVPFCLTAHFLADPGKAFWPAVRKAVKRGLSQEDALASLTIRPAALYDMADRLGTIETGKIANLVVATGDLFSNEKSKVAAMWIGGDYFEKKAAREVDLEGLWAFSWSGAQGFPRAEIAKRKGKWSLQFRDQTLPFVVSDKEIILSVPAQAFGLDRESGLVRLQAYATSSVLSGSGRLPDGSPLSWTAHRVEAGRSIEPIENASDPEEEESPEWVFDRYPAGAYGIGERERPEFILVKNATLWTCGPEGTLARTDLLVKNGKILKIGKRLKAPRGAWVIEAEGKHVTPGLIDCHSHIAGSRGINETGSAITVEVRIADIINPVDINIYRQLAGGLTTSNILHGSANPMGGQNQVIKLRWGEDAEGLKFAGARPGVKFALGENVKQSNRGDNSTSRYPQTRMGVEQFFLSNFRAAADYQRSWKAYEEGSSLAPPRRNLRLEATLEILKGERDIHIHSYRQDEVLMFARLAEKLKLKVAAFQHILEGYKVADALVKIGAGGSSFSDWWAYKFEVYDAIPYNGALMHRAGVVTSFNSDNAELATRLNTEAAKAVKYGGVSEEEALKFVTLNPAIQLGIEDRVGSLARGKDADFVIWSDHPLSTYAHAEQTWIDGIKRFDREESHRRQAADLQEREKLVQKALKVRLQELKLTAAGKGESSRGEEEETDPPGRSFDWQWIYHDGTVHYSCSGLDEEAH